MSNTYFDDQFKLLLDKYSPIILRDLITTFRQCNHTIVPHINLETVDDGDAMFSVDGFGLNDKIFIFISLPLYSDDDLKNIYQDAIRTAPDLKSASLDGLKLQEKNVVFLFLLTLAYKKLATAKNVIEAIIYEEIDSEEEFSTVRFSLNISKYTNYSTSPCIFIKRDL